MVSEKALKDFEVYAKGVKRLGELEKELESLDTKGFEKEKREIKKKLKSVHLIPQIEHDLKELKAKISGIDLDFEKTKLDRFQSKQIRLLGEKEKLASRVPYLSDKINVLKDRIEKAKKAKQKKQLSRRELKEIRRIPRLEHQISYLKRILQDESEEIARGEEEIESLEPKVERALRAAYRKQLTKQEIKDVEAIPSLRGKINYLRGTFGKESEKIKKIESEMQRMLREIPEIEQKFPVLNRRVGFLQGLFKKEQKEIKGLGMQTEKISGIKRRINAISSLLGVKSEEIAREEAEIDTLKKRLSLLKQELGRKAETLEKELEQRTNFPAKKIILGKIEGLNEKVNKNKEELYNKLTESLAESRWSVEKEKQELREELKDIIAESKWMIEKEAQDINEQLLNEIKKINEHLEKSKKEIHDNIQSKLIQLKTHINEIERQKTKEEILRNKTEENLELKEIQKIQHSKGIVPQPFLPPPEYAPIKIEEKSANKLKTEILQEFRRNLDELKFKRRDILELKPKQENYNSFEEVQELPEIKFSKLTMPEPIEIMKMYGAPMPVPIKFKDLKNKSEEKFLQEQVKPVHHKLPEIPKEEFLKELKSAVLRQQREQSAKQITAELKPQEKRTQELDKQTLKKLTKPFFLELNKFKETEENFYSIKSQLNILEHNVGHAVSGKKREIHEIHNLADEINEIKSSFDRIKESVLSKVKD